MEKNNFIGKIRCIDDQMIHWRERTKWKHYCPDKSTKFCFKTFILYDASTNYINNFDINIEKK